MSFFFYFWFTEKLKNYYKTKAKSQEESFSAKTQKLHLKQIGSQLVTPVDQGSIWLTPQKSCLASQQSRRSVHVPLKLASSVSFFIRNSIFLSRHFIRNSVFHPLSSKNPPELDRRSSSRLQINELSILVISQLAKLLFSQCSTTRIQKLKLSVHKKNNQDSILI